MVDTTDTTVINGVCKPRNMTNGAPLVTIASCSWSIPMKNLLIVIISYTPCIYICIYIYRMYIKYSDIFLVNPLH